MNLRKQSSAYVGMQSFLIQDVHTYVWQSGRKVASSRVAPQDELISLSQQQMNQAAGTGCFLRVAMSHARTNQRRARRARSKAKVPRNSCPGKHQSQRLRASTKGERQQKTR